MTSSQNLLVEWILCFALVPLAMIAIAWRAEAVVRKIRKERGE